MKCQQLVTLSLAVALAATLAGCSKPAEPSDEAAETPASMAAKVADDIAPQQVSEGSSADGPRLDGYGPLRFGQDDAAVRKAWPQPLAGDVSDEYCHSLRPEQVASAPVTVIFMIEGHRFVRYDVRDADQVAPGGGRIGMTAGELQQLYPQRAELQPHKYLEKGKNFRVSPERDGDGVLNFEIGDDGKVSAWRAGLPPQVDYVEGCS